MGSPTGFLEIKKFDRTYEPPEKEGLSILKSF